MDIVKITPATQNATLDKALDKILAPDIDANTNVPEFDNSAMNGYALALKSEKINVAGIFN